MAKDFRRQQVYLDKNVQSAIIWRVVCYWCFFMVTTMNLLFFWRILTGPYAPLIDVANELIDRFCPALFASIALIPVVIIDTIRLSHRFVGPVFRLRSAMRDVATGKRIRPIKFRNDDYWQEMAGEFNDVIARIPGQGEVVHAEDSSEEVVA